MAAPPIPPTRPGPIGTGLAAEKTAGGYAEQAASHLELPDLPARHISCSASFAA
jgi:hypothetical protein